MLRHRVLLDQAGLRVAEVRCTGRAPDPAAPEPVTTHGVVVVRRGRFLRRQADGVEYVADPMTAYVQRAGTEQRIAHPAGGDVCTSITLGAPAMDDAPPAAGPIFVAPRLDLLHRRLVLRAGHGADPISLADDAATLVAELLAAPRPPPAARARHRLLADQAREALDHDASQSLPVLAGALAVSPYHLSRVFHGVTGVTLCAYRIRLRIRHAVDRLERGDRDLSSVAADVGFADHAHLARALRTHSGLTPSQARALLAAAPAERA